MSEQQKLKKVGTGQTPNSVNEIQQEQTKMNHNNLQIIPEICESIGAGDDSGHFSESMDIISTPSSVSTPEKSIHKDTPEKILRNLKLVRENGCCKELTSKVSCCDEQNNNSNGCDKTGCQIKSNEQIDKSLSKKNITKKSDSYLTALASNFNKLYEGKLEEMSKYYEKSEIELLRENSILYQDWIKDLKEQSSILIETVEEMEQETDRKIELLQKKMNNSIKLTEQHMKMITEYERQVQELLNQRIQDDKEIDKLRTEITNRDNRQRKLQDKLNNSEAEVENLVSLITRIRDMGVWDTIGLHFEKNTYFQLFGLHPKLPGSEVQTVFTREKAKKAREAEKEMENLNKKVQELVAYKTKFEEMLKDKESQMLEMENINDRLKEELKTLNQQNQEINLALEETQTRLVKATIQCNEATEARENDKASMINEIRILKDQLTDACNERQSATKESTLLKNEMSQRINEIHQVKNLLRSIQAETESTKSQMKDVRDLQTQLSPLKEQVNLYQAKYEEAQDSLRSKNDAIDSLQTQMQQLQEKVGNLEIASQKPQLYSSKSRSCQSAIGNAIEVGEHSSRQRRPQWNEHFVRNRKDKDSMLSKNVDSINLDKNYAKKLFDSSKNCEVPNNKKMSCQSGDVTLNRNFMKKHQEINEKILEARRNKPAIWNTNDPANRNDKEIKDSRSYENLKVAENTEKSRKICKNHSKFYAPAAASKHNHSAMVLTRSTTNPIEIYKYCENPNRRIRADFRPTRAESLDKINSIPLGHSHRPTSPCEGNIHQMVKKPQHWTAAIANHKECMEKEEKVEDVDVHSKTLDALVSAAVKASHQMMEKFGNEDVNLKVTATRTHHRKDKLKVLSGEKYSKVKQNFPENDCKFVNNCNNMKSLKGLPAHLQALTRPKTAVVYRNETSVFDISKSKSTEKCFNQPIAEPKKFKPWSRKHQLLKVNEETSTLKNNKNPDFPENILASLPMESQEFIVENWIVENCSQSLRNLSERRKVSSKDHVSREFCNKDLQSAEKRIIANGKSERINKKETMEVETNTEDSYTSSSDRNSTADEGGESEKIDKKKTSFPNYSSSSEKSTIIQIQDLKNRISVLESQLLSKDTVISSLNCEIEVGKLSKAGLTRTMESQNVEITMQKALEDHIHLLELKNLQQNILKETEIMEKNLHLAQAYNLLLRIEGDFLNEGRQEGFGDQRTPTEQRVAGAAPIHEAQNLLQRIKIFHANMIQSRDSLDRQIKENMKVQEGLRKRLKAPTSAANKNFNKLDKNSVLLQAAITKIREMRNNGNANGTDSELQQQEPIPSSSHCNAGVDNLKLSVKNLMEENERKDEQIAIRNKQISQYEKYVTSLHNEIRNWSTFTDNEKYLADPNGNVPGLGNSSATPSVRENLLIALLKEEKVSLANENQKLESEVEKLRMELNEAITNQELLEKKNEALLNSFGSVNTRVGNLIEGFESVQDQWRRSDEQQPSSVQQAQQPRSNINGDGTNLMSSSLVLEELEEPAPAAAAVDLNNNEVNYHPAFEHLREILAGLRQQI